MKETRKCYLLPREKAVNRNRLKMTEMMQLADGTFQKLCTHKYVPSVQSCNIEMMREMKERYS